MPGVDPSISVAPTRAGVVLRRPHPADDGIGVPPVAHGVQAGQQKRAPHPAPRSAAATPVGPKKLRRVQSWQANPITPAFTAMKQDGGLAPNAVSHSAAQAALKFARTQVQHQRLFPGVRPPHGDPGLRRPLQGLAQVRERVELDEHVRHRPPRGKFETLNSKSETKVKNI